MNWKEVATTDRALRESVDSTAEALARHRWENTLGATPKQSFSEYARRCGVSEGTVRQWANAHAIRSSATNPTDIDVALLRARSTAERAEVVEAIAEARSQTVGTVGNTRREEVRRVAAVAKERAEAHGTTVREEATKIALITVRQEKTAKSTATARKGRVDMRYLELERHIATARRALTLALRVDVELDTELRELLADSISKVRSLLSLIDARFVGLDDQDWEREIAALFNEETAS